MKYSQDFKQKVKSCFSFVKEMYRVVMGTFIISWVPHGCKECLLLDDISGNNGIVTVGQYGNIVTFLSIFLLYLVEMKREFTFIENLEVNDKLARDNDSVGLILHNLDKNDRNKLWKWDERYHKCFDVSSVLFVLNTLISSHVIFNVHGAVNKTHSVLLTNVLFFSMKLFSIYQVKKSDKNVFYSAYLRKMIQYNDVDPDKAIISTISGEDNCV